MTGRSRTGTASSRPSITKDPEVRVPPDGLAEAILRRDRLVVLGGLGLVAVLAWVEMARMAGGMAHGGMDMADMAVPHVHRWALADGIVTAAMWTVMMVAMMVPSAAPAVLTYAALHRGKREVDAPYAPTGAFLLGYLVVWMGFSVLAAFGQWALHMAALLTPMGVSISPALSGILLVAAGAFQWTPLKNACLNHCRSPFGFLVREWRGGPDGAFVMGLRHGAYCVTCCWILMLLMFVLGVMNLLWMAALTAFVVLEKVAPGGDRLGRIAGLLMVAWGAWLVLAR